MKKFKVGLQLYSVRSEIEKDLAATLRCVKAMGYDYIESAGPGFYGLSADEAKALLAELGLTLYSVHSTDVSDKNLALLQALGVKNFTIPYYAAANYQDWEGAMAYFKDCAERVHTSTGS